MSYRVCGAPAKALAGAPATGLAIYRVAAFCARIRQTRLVVLRRGACTCARRGYAAAAATLLNERRRLARVSLDAAVCIANEFRRVGADAIEIC
jgi:hypothetical protein